MLCKIKTKNRKSLIISHLRFLKVIPKRFNPINTIKPHKAYNHCKSANYRNTPIAEVRTKFHNIASLRTIYLFFVRTLSTFVDTL